MEVTAVAERPRSRAALEVVAPATDTPLISVKGVIRIYREADVETVALRGVDLDVMPGEYVAVMGRSGSGKTTLLNLLAGLDRPSAGRVLVDGVDIGRADEGVRSELRGRKVGLVLQSQNLLPYLSIEENVQLAARLADADASTGVVRTVLERVHLTNRARHRPEQLSGGEQLRAGLACVAVAAPPLLLGDEVTGELDSVSAAAVLAVLADLHAAGTTIVLVTHDPVVAAATHRIVELRDGRVAADRPVR